MAFVQERKSKGRTYIYLDKSVRIGKKVRKVSKFLGEKSKMSKNRIRQEMKRFSAEIDSKTLKLVLEQAKKRYHALRYPLSFDEIKKIEEMNLKYRKIRSSLGRNDWIDIKKRFVANFVFESNALEGNSLTLKNFSEIIFESRITDSADLREVYDAQNSYKVFSSLFNMKKKITEKLIINIHKRIMKNIDKRVGYKKIPNVLLGVNIKLTEPENVHDEMEKLIKWYNDNKDNVYPLELAFVFHHRFEKIHAFSDGNGRVGRMLLNYILIKKGYFPIIIRKSNRNTYLKALNSADHNQTIPLMRFALDKAKQTYRKFFEVYVNYV
ncbi:MAG: Fic family protein [Candidatus Woesearchaeota archaeon]